MTLLPMGSCGKAKDTLNVVIVIPDGYRGLAAITPGSSGAPIAENSAGQANLTIPLNGALVVRDTRPLQSIGKVTAFWASGGALPVHRFDEYASSEHVALFFVSMNQDGVFHVLIGSSADLDRIRAERDCQLGGVLNVTAPRSTP